MPTQTQSHWLFKTDPDTYSFSDLEKREKDEVWDGVKNPVALRHLRAVRPRDQVLIYHTGKEKAIIGLAEVTRGGYPDPSDPKLVVVNLKSRGRLPRPVTLAELRKDPRYRDFDLLRLSRLSVMPVPGELWNDLLAKGGWSRSPV